MLDVDRIIALSQDMDDAPELTAEQAEQLTRLLNPQRPKRRRRTA